MLREIRDDSRIQLVIKLLDWADLSYEPHLPSAAAVGDNSPPAPSIAPSFDSDKPAPLEGK